MEWRKRVGEEEANKISRQASTRGTAVHQLCEDYINNVPDWNKDVMPNNLASFLDLKKIIDERLDNVWFQEEFLYSDKLGCAGQVDCIAEFDGQLSINSNQDYTLFYNYACSFIKCGGIERSLDKVVFNPFFFLRFS